MSLLYEEKIQLDELNKLLQFICTKHPNSDWRNTILDYIIERMQEITDNEQK